MADDRMIDYSLGREPDDSECSLIEVFDHLDQEDAEELAIQLQDPEFPLLAFSNLSSSSRKA